MLRAACFVLILASAGCHLRRPPVSRGIFDGCLDDGRPLEDCKAAVGCEERLTEEECRRSFAKRHKLYIHYD